MIRAIGRWLCRRGFHAMKLHHSSGVHDYRRCARCDERAAIKVYAGNSALDDYWLAGNDGEPPAPVPPRTGSGVQSAAWPRVRKGDVK